MKFRRTLLLATVIGTLSLVAKVSPASKDLDDPIVFQ
jgi:hypothetical protein